MKVSVFMLAFNHEQFVAQAIESVLMQKVSFDYELVIGEDCSTDGTREILERYQRQHPTKIRLLLHSKNIGMIPNTIATYEACSGEYIALLECDDYWTSAEKLAKQVAYLDSNPDCSECYHLATTVDEHGEEMKTANPRRLEKPKYTFEDFVRGDFYPWTCTVMLRRQLLPKLPDWFIEAPVADFFFHALMASRGTIGYIGECMASYRIHGGGIWSEGVSPSEWSAKGLHKRYTKRLQIYECLKGRFDSKYERLIGMKISEAAYDLAWLHRCRRNWSDMRSMLLKGFRSCPRNPNVTWVFIIKCFILAYVPILDRAFRRNSNLELAGHA